MPQDPTKQGLFYPRSGDTATMVVEPSGAGALAVPPAGVGRRTLFRWVGWGLMLALVGQWLYGFIQGFFVPKRVGAFGGDVTVGPADALKVGEVRRVQEGKFYLSRVPEGYVALWWKCPHLGCTVPWKPDDPSEDGLEAKGRFNCPCHGSIYDRYGQIITGPAPRPMDAFKVRIEGGKVIVSTGPNNVITRDRTNPKDGITPV